MIPVVYEEYQENDQDFNKRSEIKRGVGLPGDDVTKTWMHVSEPRDQIPCTRSCLLTCLLLPCTCPLVSLCTCQDHHHKMTSHKVKRILLLCLGFTTFILGSIIFIYPSPDLSAEEEIVHKIAEMSVKLQHIDTLNDQRKLDLQGLSSQFKSLLRLVKEHQDQYENNNSSLNKRLAEYSNQGFLSGNFSQTYDLSLPSVETFLPNTIKSPHSFTPAFKISRNRAHVSIVIGIPTVKRQYQSYLLTTLQSVIDNMSKEDMDESLIVIFIAETDPDFVYQISAEVQKQFQKHLDSGLLEIISPPSEFYPDMSGLKQTLGDDMERVTWRSKQALDFSFLMMYAKDRGTFYVQLEDDVLTKKGFISTMKHFALGKIAEKKPWFVIDFCQLGFIGKMFKSVELPWLVNFFLMFYNDKPVDWLLENLIQTKVCKLDQDNKKCKKEKEKLWIHYKPSLFQHIGTHSSLKGKVQKLKDRQFGRVQLFVPHKNPAATIESPIKHYKHHSLIRAYQGDTFFWGLVPQPGDKILFTFEPPVLLESFKFVSGNAEHPSDRFLNTTCEVFLEDSTLARRLSKLPKLKDDYFTVGGFDNFGIAEGVIGPEVGKVKKFRLTINSSSENWAILSEIYFKKVS